MNTDVNLFAGYEPNRTGGAVDLEDDFDLAGAAGRSRKNWERVWRKRSGNRVNTIFTAMARVGIESSRARTR